MTDIFSESNIMRGRGEIIFAGVVGMSICV